LDPDLVQARRNGAASMIQSSYRKRLLLKAGSNTLGCWKVHDEPVASTSTDVGVSVGEVFRDVEGHDVSLDSHPDDFDTGFY